MKKDLVTEWFQLDDKRSGERPSTVLLIRKYRGQKQLLQDWTFQGRWTDNLALILIMSKFKIKQENNLQKSYV